MKGNRAVDEGQLLVSEATMTELADVLGRAKFDPYKWRETGLGLIAGKLYTMS